MLRPFLRHHILANLVFILVLALGTNAYLQLPRQQDPSVNFNWVQIITAVPGASTEDVEKQVTDVLEEAVGKIADIRFSSSTSREEISSILVRFNDLPEQTFLRRLADLRREIRNSQLDLPADAERPEIYEITSANAFASAIVIAVGIGDDETLRRQASLVEREFERLQRIDRVDAIGLQNPELQVLIETRKLEGLGVSPATVSNTVGAYFRDLSAGTVSLRDQSWLVRLSGKDNDPAYLARLPILTNAGEIPLRSVARVVRSRESATQLVSYQNQPAVMLAIYKRPDANVLALVDEIRAFISDYNDRARLSTGIKLVLLDDQTAVTVKALEIMEQNAMIGLSLVLATSWVFLGARIAALATIGIPFVLAGTFWVLALVGETLNVIVLLGIVMSLGMLVDDAIVVAEAIYLRLEKGVDALDAAADALGEVAAPVTASVLTTIAAFLPLMLMPGLLGEFMRVAPIVVTTALALSLIEAFWMLPAHITALPGTFTPGARRRDFISMLRRLYAKSLIPLIRRPAASLLILSGVVAAAAIAVAGGMIRFEFFATDSARLFYVDVEMPAGTRLESTLSTTQRLEHAIKATLDGSELRGTAAYAGIKFTEKEPLYGDQHGQVLVTLNPKPDDGRTVKQVISEARVVANQVAGPLRIAFRRVIQGAPPSSKPINIKVRGDNLEEIRRAADAIIGILRNMPAVTDITDDDIEGRLELAVRLDPDAVVRAGLNPATVARDLRILADGEVVASMRDRGEELNVRVRAQPDQLSEIEGFLRHTIGLPDGSGIALGQLLEHKVIRARGNIRHYDLRRAITVESDLNKTLMDTPEAINWIQARWLNELAPEFADIDLDFTGELDDIRESLDAMLVLFTIGIGLIYLILGTQFRSYGQPFIVLATVPMAFTGVVAGLIITGNPLSLYTLYGMIALAGIGVNSAIVMISAANTRRTRHMPVGTATIYAAKRRLVPILITSLTTIGGLFSLAMGFGGKSLMWGPLATSIVWGLGVSTILTLYCIPLLYALLTGGTRGREDRHSMVTVPNTKRSFRLLYPVRGATWREAFREIKDDPHLADFNAQGCNALRSKKYDMAVKAFEQAASLAPENGVIRARAAEALLLYMDRVIGWDVGYMVRARRHLAEAEKSLGGDPRVDRLLQMYGAIEPVLETE